MTTFEIVASLVAMFVVVVALEAHRFQDRVADEMRALLAGQPMRDEAPLGDLDLPAPVARYRDLAVGDRRVVKTLRMRHHGTFRTRPKSKLRPIEGLQFFTANPPGFVWSARIAMAPGLWFDARDELIGERGGMLVAIDGTLPVVDATGPAIDEGAALRLLAELVWMPTAFFDPRFVRWSSIDECHARATLRLGAREVSATFEFDASGLPSSVRAERFMDGDELRPWGGTYRDYRTVSGMRVPFEVEVTWQLESGPFTYAHWLLDSVECDVDAVTEVHDDEVRAQNAA